MGAVTKWCLGMALKIFFAFRKNSLQFFKPYESDARVWQTNARMCIQTWLKAPWEFQIDAEIPKFSIHSSSAILITVLATSSAVSLSIKNTDKKLSNINFRTHGILSTDCNMADRNRSVASCKFWIDCSIRSLTAACCNACSWVTSYGKPLDNKYQLLHIKTPQNTSFPSFFKLKSQLKWNKPRGTCHCKLEKNKKLWAANNTAIRIQCSTSQGRWSALIIEKPADKASFSKLSELEPCKKNFLLLANTSSSKLV